MVNYTFPGIITVRTKSKRLPNKCLKKFGKKTVIDHVIDRCIYYSIEPIMCTTTNTEDDILEQISEKKNIKCFRGSELNKIKRWSDCVKRFNLSYFHSIDADDPFFDGDEMKKSIDLLLNGRSDIIYPSNRSSKGLASVGYSMNSKAIHNLHDNFPEEIDTEFIWEFIGKSSELKYEILPDDERADINLRLTLDYHEDYEMLTTLRKTVGEFASRDDIYKAYYENPAIAEINWSKNKDFLINQKREI